MKPDSRSKSHLSSHPKGKFNFNFQLRGSLPRLYSARMQKDFGLGSLFRRLYPTAQPFAKSGTKLLDIKLLDTVTGIIKDIIKDKTFRKALEKWGKPGGLKYNTDVVMFKI